MRAALCRALHSRRGSAAVEFAIVALPLVTLFVGIVEISWQLTTGAALDEAVLRASRFGITGQARSPGEPPEYTCRSDAIKWIITGSTGGFLKSDPAHLTVTMEASTSPSGGTPVAGAGSGGQIVTYTVDYKQPFLTGAFALIGGSASLTHRVIAVVKNEPFDNAPC